ncbi:hypothetical protein M405DRAFT_839676 [Rhizopogon salebrosus TDB-379]|nr:hypothetical protein M405DRAFT_839676 [Rhizopogon salebrosus TDB-379]
MFEVEHFRYAILATVSLCGMIWFSEDVIEPSMVYRHYLNTPATVPLDADDEDAADTPGCRTGALAADASDSANIATQVQIASILERYFAGGDLVSSALTFAESIDHIVDFTSARALHTLFSLLNKMARNVIEYNLQHSDFPLAPERVEQYVTKRLLVSIILAFSGDAKLDLQAEMGDLLRKQTGIDLPPLVTGFLGSPKRPPLRSMHTLSRLQILLYLRWTLFATKKCCTLGCQSTSPLMLCGPPGSGKTVTLFSALRKLPDMDVVGLNFSSATTPELILKTFEQYCEYRKTPNGVILTPVQIRRWLVVFCDEINLPAQDKYGTQRVISLHQLVECGGYWRASDKAWVKLERIQFVGVCNPPIDPGRVPLSHHFRCHAPLVVADYPGEVFLKQIYGTYNRKHFTTDIQAHYVHSPRELTRWVRGIYEAIRPLEMLSIEGLVCVWAHGALRLFQDRLVTEKEKPWMDKYIGNAAMEHFPTINRDEALHRPILFSNWTSKHSSPVDREELLNAFPDSLQQARAIGLFGGCGGVACIFGLLFGAMLAEWASYHWVFWFAAIVALLVATACVFIIPPQIAKTTDRLEPGASKWKKS